MKTSLKASLACLLLLPVGCETGGGRAARTTATDDVPPLERGQYDEFKAELVRDISRMIENEGFEPPIIILTPPLASENVEAASVALAFTNTLGADLNKGLAGKARVGRALDEKHRLPSSLAFTADDENPQRRTLTFVLLSQDSRRELLRYSLTYGDAAPSPEEVVETEPATGDERAETTDEEAPMEAEATETEVERPAEEPKPKPTEDEPEAPPEITEPKPVAEAEESKPDTAAAVESEVAAKEAAPSRDAAEPGEKPEAKETEAVKEDAPPKAPQVEGAPPTEEKSDPAATTTEKMVEPGAPESESDEAQAESDRKASEDKPKSTESEEEEAKPGADEQEPETVAKESPPKPVVKEEKPEMETTKVAVDASPSDAEEKEVPADAPPPDTEPKQVVADAPPKDAETKEVMVDSPPEDVAPPRKIPRKHRIKIDRDKEGFADFVRSKAGHYRHRTVEGLLGSVIFLDRDWREYFELDEQRATRTTDDRLRIELSFRSVSDEEDAVLRVIFLDRDGKQAGVTPELECMFVSVASKTIILTATDRAAVRYVCLVEED